MAGDVQIKLAHPLEPRDVEYLGLDTGKYREGVPVGETITLRRDLAHTVIASGYAAVDPEDPQAVAAALMPAQHAENASAETAAVAVGVEPPSGAGNGDVHAGQTGQSAQASQAGQGGGEQDAAPGIVRAPRQRRAGAES